MDLFDQFDIQMDMFACGLRVVNQYCLPQYEKKERESGSRPAGELTANPIQTLSAPSSDGLGEIHEETDALCACLGTIL